MAGRDKQSAEKWVVCFLLSWNEEVETYIGTRKAQDFLVMLDHRNRKVQVRHNS